MKRESVYDIFILGPRKEKEKVAKFEYLCFFSLSYWEEKKDLNDLSVFSLIKKDYQLLSLSNEQL